LWIANTNGSMTTFVPAVISKRSSLIVRHQWFDASRRAAARAWTRRRDRLAGLCGPRDKDFDGTDFHPFHGL
jgi:hypothetical protein